MAETLQTLFGQDGVQTYMLKLYRIAPRRLIWVIYCDWGEWTPRKTFPQASIKASQSWLETYGKRRYKVSPHLDTPERRLMKIAGHR